MVGPHGITRGGSRVRRTCLWTASAARRPDGFRLISGTSVFALVLTSDLGRARETARTIASVRGLTPVLEPRLREAAFGEWEGLTFAEVSAKYPEISRDWALDPFRCTPPGAESLTALTARVDEVRRRVLAAGDGTNVLAVTHGGPARLLICLALGLEPGNHWRFALGPGGMAVLEFHDGEGILCRLDPKPSVAEVVRIGKAEALW